MFRLLPVKKLSFAPRKNVLSRSERRLCPRHERRATMWCDAPRRLSAKERSFAERKTTLRLSRIKRSRAAIRAEVGGMETKAAAPAKKGMKALFVWVLLAAMAATAGASLPLIVRGKTGGPPRQEKRTRQAQDRRHSVRRSRRQSGRGASQSLPARQTPRRRRGTDAKEMTELLAKQKAFLKDWLIGYLFSHSSQDVGRSRV